MIATVSLNKQGQVSIPAKFRKALGWSLPMKVSVTQRGDKIVIQQPDSLMDLYGSLSSYATKNKGLSLDEIISRENKAIVDEIVKQASKV